MCGIFGLVSNGQLEFSPDEISRSLRHRGPDDEGWVIINSRVGDFVFARGHDTIGAYDRLPHINSVLNKGDIALLSRRLSILDPSPAGHQPMEYDNLIIVFNGEIYNYVELKRELVSHGYTFETNSDTEVLLKAFHRWGLESLDRLNGMFAFAIYDMKNRKLFLARDRFGKKPIYYTFQKGNFAFASEIKALFKLPFVGRNFNKREVIRYLVYAENEVEKFTIFESILKLNPSHYMEFDVESRSLKVIRYYKIPDIADRIGFNEAKDRFLHLLRDSIKLRFRSDVKVGTSLSGGLDSSSIVYMASHLDSASNSYYSFSSVHPEYSYLDESKYIDMVVEDTGVKNVKIAPDEAFVRKNLERFVYHQEEPTSTLSPFSQFAVYSLPRKYDVIVLLDGQGGDEGLAGYLRYVPVYLKELLMRGRFIRFLKELKEFRKTNLDYRELFLRMMGMGVPLRTFFNLRSRRLFRRIPPFIEPPGRIRSSVGSLREKLIVEMEENIPVLLRYADKNSSAYSIEVRSPYLDYRLVEFMLSIPSEYKIYDGWTKYIARKAFESFMDRRIVYRRDKLGFPFPQKELVPVSRFAPLVSGSGILKEIEITEPENIRHPLFWRVLNIALIERVFGV